MRTCVLVAILACCGWLSGRATGQESAGITAPGESGDTGGATASATPLETNEDEANRRGDLNLLGVTDLESGESRRNENVQFNPVDNNAIQELNIRMGITATVVREFDPEQNYFGSEFGTEPTPSIHLPATGGHSGLHGTLYESHSNGVVTARSFFQVGDVKPSVENRYGFSLQIPLSARSLLSMEGSQQKIRGYVNGNVLIPKANERTPLATDPATRTIVEKLLAAYPDELPNRTDIDERALNTNSPQYIDTDDLGLRFDQDVRSNRFATKYELTSQRVTAFQLVAGQNPDTTTKAHTAGLSWSRAWNAGTQSDVSMGFERVGTLLVPAEGNIGPNVRASGALEQIGPSASIPLDRAENLFRYGARLRRAVSKHALTVGFDLARRQRNGSESSTHRGVLHFRNQFGRDAITNLRMGTPGRFSGAVGEAHRGFRSSLMQYYLGDEWRVRSNVSLHFGLRYEPLPKPREVNGLNEFPYSCDCNNVSGTFGFAYRLPGPFGVLRAAYGTHYADIVPSTYEQVRFNAPLTVKFTDNSPNLVEVLRGLSAVPNPNARSTLYALSSNTVSPYSHQYNLTWEPLSSPQWRLQLAYIGSRTYKLFMRLHTNRARQVPGVEQTPGTLDLRRPNEAFFDVRNVVNASRAYFDAGRASLTLPRWKGLTVDGSYWFSKSLDLGADYTSTGTRGASASLRSQSEDLVFEDLKGPSDFDQRHASLWSLTYEVPNLVLGDNVASRFMRDWQFSMVVLLKTGPPFSVVTGSDAPGFGNVDGENDDRPNLVDASVLGATIGHPDGFSGLPRSAFAFIQGAEERGNLGRNTFRRDGISNINASLSRTFFLRSDKALTVRAESINLFNTPQFAAPTAELTAPSFGRITNTLNAGRTFQLLMRFTF